ncbi:MAG: agmatinase [Phycisphaerales bacterium]
MPRTILADTRRQPRFAGVSTFCRYPLLDLVPAESRPVDWAIYGVPYDTGVTYRPGARFAPRAIRDASQYVKRYSMFHDVDVCETLSLADAGDAPVNPYSPKQTLDAVSEFAKGLADPTTRLLAVGGDHSIAYANLRATWERQGRPNGGLSLLHFDSHLDTVDQVWGEKWGHASPFIRAIEDGLVNPARMISVGIKGPLNTPTDLDYAKTHGVTVLTYDDYAATGGDKALRDFVERQGDHPAYVSFDIDVVDPAYAPGTGTPSVGGLTSAQALGAVRSLVGANVVGADVVEVLPDRDPAGITALLAAHIIFEIICLDAARRTK